jgi:hypothetical protein
MSRSGMVDAKAKSGEQVAEAEEAAAGKRMARAESAAGVARGGARAAGLIESTLSAQHPAEPSSRLRRADDYAALILKIVTVLALTFGLFEYDRQKADARVTQSLDMVQEWESGGYRDAYARINDLLLPIYEQNASAIAAVGKDADARALIYGNIGETVTGRDDVFSSPADHDVDLVFQFFDRAALCADQTICDYGVLRTFFAAESESFWLYFARYAGHRQADGYAGYGAWTHKFVDGDIRTVKFLGLF